MDGWIHFFCLQRAVELLLKHKAEVNAKDKFWHTPLHMAAAKWATGCALVLIPHVCSLDVADRSGRTPLHHAAYSGHEEVRINHYLFLLCLNNYILRSTFWVEDIVFSRCLWSFVESGVCRIIYIYSKKKNPQYLL